MDRLPTPHRPHPAFVPAAVLGWALALAGCDATPGGAGAAQTPGPAAPAGAAPVTGAPRPSAPFSKAMARFGAELYAASRDGAPGAALEARATAEGWDVAPPDLRSIHGTERAWLAPLDDAQVIVAHDPARGMVIVAATHGFDAAAAKRELESGFALELVNRLNGAEATMSHYFLKQDGRDYAMVGIMLGTAGTARGTGLLGFLPAEVARREMDRMPAS